MNEEEETQAPQEQTSRQAEETAKSLIEQAKEQADRIEAGNAKYEELVAREEAAKARSMLEGKSYAGQEAEKPVEETPKEYSERIMKGEQ